MPSYTLTSVSIQDQVDYVHFAQQRVAADTRALAKSATLELESGVGTYDVPADLIELLGIFGDNVELDPIPVERLLAALSGVGPGNYNRQQGYAIVGRTLYILPTPSQAQTLTLLYVNRPAAFASDSDLGVSGEARTLVDDLLDGEISFDRGETEVGAAGLEAYEQRALLLRRRLGVRGTNRMRVIGADILT